jgi:Protein of unknown function (DUF3037)
MKASKTAFSYVVLRYMHDVFTREFVNVGMLLYAPTAGFLHFEKLPSLDRVKGMFPGLDSGSLQDLLAFLASRVEGLKGETSELLDRDLLSADVIAKSLLPPDDSALQWSASGGGVTDNPEQTVKQLFERLVARHLKAHPPTRRRDADIWRPFEREFRQRDILAKFQDKTLAVGELRHHFEIAWQPSGGYLRLFQPLSFDLVDPSEIVQKAVLWGALVPKLREAEPDFYIYLLVGRPADKARLRAFDQAYETLTHLEDSRKELIPEDDAPRFADTVEREMRAAAAN